MSIAATVTLGDVACFVRGITFKPDDLVERAEPDAVDCMRTSNVQAQLDTKDVWAVPSRFVKRSDQLLSEGDLLVSTANSWNLIGKCCWIPKLERRTTLGGFISALRADRAKLLPRYLYHWFSSPNVQADARSCGRQTTNISNLDLGRCLKLMIPLPPMEEQRRIAAILDRAEALRAKRREALAKLDTLTQSLFLEMFGDPLRDTAAHVSLNSIAEIVSGITKGRPVRGQAVTAVAYLRVANVQAGYLNLSEMKSIEATTEEITRLNLKSGDIVMTEGGDFDKLGRGALWSGAIAPCIHQNHVFRVRLNINALLPEVFHWYLQARLAKDYFLKCAKKTSNLASINMTQLKALPVFSPAMSLQQEFFTISTTLGTLQAAKLASVQTCDDLFHSLQHRAFRGEL